MKTPQKQIKDLLIRMAISGELPSDMNELDENIFNPFVLSKERIERYAEDQAIGQYLSDYDDSLSYSDIINHLNAEEMTADIVVWQPFEYHDFSEVAKFMEQFKGNVISSLSDLFYSQKRK